MTVGLSIFLIAVGAILKYAVTESIEGIKIDVVGTILMIVGILGLIISILYMVLSTSDRGRRAGPPPPYDAPTRRDRF
jgi:uncharacterized membrane protein YbhN (UPF0104 family)